MLFRSQVNRWSIQIRLDLLCTCDNGKQIVERWWWWYHWPNSSWTITGALVLLHGGLQLSMLPNLRKTCVDPKGKKGQHIHHDMKDAVIKNHNTNVSKMCAIFDVSYTDPFELKSPPERLVNTATGVVAALQAQQSLLGALTKKPQ